MRKLLFGALALIATTAAANATTITGTYSVTSSGSPTITDIFSTPFKLNLALGTPQTFDLAKLFEHSDATTNITATFNFTVPVVGSTTIHGTDVFSTPRESDHDSLTWSSSGLGVVNFSDGAILDITLTNESYNGDNDHYHGLTPTATFDLVQGPRSLGSPAQVPEPVTLSLFGAGLAGMALATRRRRKANKA